MTVANLQMRYVVRIRAKGRDYYYHRPTNTRLPDDPASPDFLARLDELNKQIGADGWSGIAPRKKLNRKIYFIQAASGPIKIGIASDPHRRLNNLQTSHFEKLDLLGSAAGTEEDEQQIHAALRRHHIRGEWYEPSETVIERITAFLSTRVQNRLRKSAKPYFGSAPTAQKTAEMRHD